MVAININAEGAGFRVSGRDRLDLAASAGAGISRRLARRLIEERRVLVNGRLVAVASRAVIAGDRIGVVPASFEIHAIRSTASWIAVDKPAGVPTQPGRDSGPVSMLELSAAWLDRRGESGELFVVHRLDTGTSGVLLFARTSASAASLSRAFADRHAQKEYVAIVHGRLADRFAIDAPIGRTGPSAFGVVPTGEPAHTDVTPLEICDTATLVRATITTGRTHQIRIHLAHSGYALFGDRKYGSRDDAERLMLHASRLVTPPTGELDAPLPGPMREFWTLLAAPRA